MARFWWFTAALVLALLIVTTDCLHGLDTHVEAREPTFKSRGGSRFSTKAEEGLETTPVPFTTTSRSSRRNTNRNAVPTTARPAEKIHGKTTLRNRRDHDRNIGLSKETTSREISQGTSTGRSEIRRRKSQFKTQFTEPDNDLVRAATEDRRNLLESKKVRAKEIAQEAELEVPVEDSRNVHRNRNGSMKPRSQVSNDVNRRSFSTEPNFSGDTFRASPSELRRSRISHGTSSSENRKFSTKFASRRSSSGDPNEPVESSERIVETRKTPGERIPESSNRRHDTLPANSEVVTSLPTQTSTIVSQRKAQRQRSGRRGPSEIDDDSVVENLSSSRRASQQTSRRDPGTESRSGRGGAHSESSRKMERPDKMEQTRKSSRSGDNVKPEPKIGSRGRSSRLQSETKPSPNSASRNFQPVAAEELPTPSPTVSPVTSEPVATTSQVSVLTTLPIDTTVPRENVPNHASGSRSRKNGTPSLHSTKTSVSSQETKKLQAPIRKNSALTLTRRQPQANNPPTTPSSPEAGTHEIFSSESNMEISTSPTRGRGTKFFNEPSIITKKDQELDEGDNYPPAFKAKLAQLKDTKADNARSKSSSRASEDDPTMTIFRHSRSIDHLDTEDDKFPDDISPIPPSDSDNLDFFENPKKRAPSNGVSAKSQKKLASARKLIASDSKSGELLELRNPSTTLRSDAVEPDEPKTIKGPKTFGTSRLSSTTGKAAVTVTFPTIEKKFSRTAKSISRGTVRVGETTRTKKTGRERPTTQKPAEDQLLQTTTQNRPETTSQKIATKSVKSWTVSPRGKSSTPRTLEVSSTTTRKTRAWNTAYIDKNWEEPTTKSRPMNAESFSTRFPSTTKRIRSWTSAHVDKNWEAPVTKSTIVNPESSPTKSSSTTSRSRLWYAPHTDKNWEPPTTKSTIHTEFSSTELPSTTKRSRLWFAPHTDKNWEPPTTKSTMMNEQRPTEESFQMTDNPPTRRIPVVTTTNVYASRKSESSKSLESISTSSKPLVSLLPVRPREIRPRTSTYRRHSDGTAIPSPSVLKDVAITPKAPKYNSSTSSEDSTQRSAKQKPALAVSNVTGTNDTNNSIGILLSNRGNSGSSNSNIFNPTKTTHLISSNVSLLEQLRSTVAPLLSALGNRTPIFSGSYSNVNTNSPQRVTPSGSPPRFSARYRGAELFVRKPNGLDSSGPFATTPLTSTKDTLATPEITILSPGEPKVITFYQALESASITNEIDQKTDNVKQPKGVSQIEINSDTDANSNVTNNANNDTETQMVTNLEPATTPAVSLTRVEESQDLRPDTMKSATQSDTTQTLSVNTEMPSSTPDPEPSTTFVSTSFGSTEINPSSEELEVQTSMTTQLRSESDEVIQLMQTSTGASMLTSTESATPRLDSRIDIVSDQVPNSTEENPMTTILPGNSAETGREFETQPAVTMETATIPPDAVMTESTVPSTEISDSESTTVASENLSVSTTMIQVKQEYSEATTTSLPLSTVPSDLDLATEMVIPESSTIPLNSDSSNSLSSSTIEPLIDSIDNEFFQRMMERLMRIFNLNNMTHPQNTQQLANKTGEFGQMFGGFLDNTDRNITSEVESLQTTEASNTVESTKISLLSTIESMTQTDKTIVNESSTTLVPEQTSLPEEITVVPAIVTSFQDDVATPESTTMTTNPTTILIYDTNPINVTTSRLEMMETTTPGDNQTPTVMATLEVTTNPPTSTQNTMPLEEDPIIDNPNMLAGFQDETPATAQKTAGTEAPTTSTMSSSEMPTQSSSITPSTSPTSPQTSIPKTTTQFPTNETATSPAAMTSSTDSTTLAPTTPYVGRFGGTRITPAPRFSSSSSTRQPLRDYHIYGIYPNKTIVRKRPEDNLIDARNIDSPYVIFGLYPDGKLVRKYPNGTVIPDPPSNPVEVVFSLSTTTNRPRPNQQSNQFNQGTNNKNDLISNNQSIDILTSPEGQIDGIRSQLNLGLSDNALSPNGDGPNLSNDPVSLPSVGNVDNQPTSTKMTEEVMNTQIKTSLNETGKIIDSSTTSGPPSSTTPSSVNPQGGRIIQDRERDKASRTKEAGGQRSTVYIGQDKFINYWNADPPSNDSKVVSVEINSMTNALNESPALSSGVLPDLGLVENNQASALPGSPWKDPLNQIFGIPSEIPAIKTSAASNSLDEPSASRSPIIGRPINPFSEVLTPMLDDAQLARDTSITTTTGVPSVSTTASTTSTTTPTTTTTAATTTTMSPRPATTTTALPSTSPATTTSTSTAPSTPSFTTMEVLRQTAFGTSFDDLAFLNSLLQPNGQSNFISSTPKTLTEVEQLLANKILSLALGNPGPTRSPKAIQPSNSGGNSLDQFPNPGSPSQPIIIDLLQSTARHPLGSSTTAAPITWKPSTTVTAIQKIPKAGEATSASSTTTSSEPPSTRGVWSYFPTLPPSTKPIPIGTSTESSSTQAIWKSFPTHPRLPPLTTPTTTTTTTGSSIQAVWQGFPTHPPTTKSTQEASTQGVWQGFPTHPPTTKSTQEASTQGVWQGFPTHPPTTKLTQEASTQGVWQGFPTHPPTTKSTQEASTQGVWQGFPTHPPTTKSTEEALTQGVWKGFPTYPPTTEPSPVGEKSTTAAPKTSTTSTSSKPLTSKKPSPRPTFRPRTTQAPQLGFGANLLRAIFGRDVFVLATTQKPVAPRRPVQVIKATSPKPSSTTSNYTPEDDAKLLVELLNNSDKKGKDAKNTESSLSADDESFLRSILNGQAKVRTPSPPSSSSTSNNAAILAQLLKSQGIEPSTPANQMREQLRTVSQTSETSTNRPRSLGARARPVAATNRPQSSTYPPPLFSNFNFGFQRPFQSNFEEGNGAVRNQMLNAAIGATRVFSQFLGAAITGAAQQLQSFVRNGTRLVSEAAG